VEDCVKTTIFIEDSFDSAHWLPRVPEAHKCRQMHGHTYRIRIEITGPMDSDAGWIVDYGVVKAQWHLVHRSIDHHLLNEIIENPTCELIAAHIWRELDKRIKDYAPIGKLKVSRIELRETEHCGVVLE
jgi:6-pyruvoyltetrahydropterin/6-carboxytetrahydropterin synthase